MTDISKCEGKGCDRKERCYRFTAKANPFTQFYVTPPVVGEACDYYWAIDPDEDALPPTDDGDGDYC